nr:hypothetical protein BaRGS_014552 [Batillaria attramentaria]
MAPMYRESDDVKTSSAYRMINGVTACSTVSTGYCLPVYLRCNGVYDCPGLEDERDCDKYACPGFAVRVLYKKNAKTGFHVFVTNLNLADFAMGVYLVIIGAADQLAGAVGLNRYSDLQ